MVADSAFTFVASTKPVGLEHSGRNQDRSVEKTTLIQISRPFYFGFFSKTNHQMMIQLALIQRFAPIVSRSKKKWYKAQKV